MTSFQMGALSWYFQLQKKRLNSRLHPGTLRLLAQKGLASRDKIKGVRFVDQAPGGVPCECILPEGPVPKCVLIYLHGGGYFLGSPATHRRLTASLARRLGALVIVPDYRLAPEHPYPAAFNDALAVWNGLRGVLPAGMMGDLPRFMAGDSAGGGLALALLQAVRDAGQALPRGAVLYSPWTDLTLQGLSLKTNAGSDALITEAALRTATQWYTGEHDPRAPHLSPIFGDLRDLPPLLAFADRTEMLADDTRRLEAVVRGARGEVEVQWSEGRMHAWPVFANLLPEARETIGATVAWIEQRLAI